MGKLGQTISGLSGKNGEDFGAGKPYVTYKQVFDCAQIDLAKCARVRIAANERQNKLQRGDVLFTASSETPDEVGFASVLLDSPPEPLYLNSFCFALRPDSLEVLTPEFARYLFHSPIYRKSIGVMAQGITRFNISKGAFLKLKLPISSDANEQQKIAECLSYNDELISSQAQKVEALKAHKKGLMQQLFPAEGETMPKLRFPEFRGAGAWKKQKVSSLLERVSEPVNVDLNETYRQIGIRSHGKGIFYKDLVNGKELGNKRVFWVEENAFIVNIVFAWEQAVAITSEKEIGMIASHRFPMYKAKLNKSDVNFIKHFFLTRKGKELLGVASPGGAGRNKTLGQKEFAGLEFILPEKVEEQIKIAECLSSIDALITAQAQRVEALKGHKKGLMQQLFPSVEEVNG